MLYWSGEAAAHIQKRSARYPGAADIEPEWTEEVIDEPDALWFEPDPKSKSGLGIRVIGYSVSAGFVITVVAYRRRRVLWGATAYKASGAELRAYREGLT